MAKKLEGLSGRFDRTKLEPRYRIIGASYGEVATGRTHWWLGAPGPMVIFSLDQGLEGVVEPFQEDKEIYARTYDWSPTDEMTQAEAVAVRDQIIDEFEFSIQHARTILWDKETQIWEVFRYAEFGAPNDAPRNYAALNQRYNKIFAMAKASSANFGFIQDMKDLWQSRTKKDGSGTQGFNTGQRVRQGNSDLAAAVFFDFFHRREEGQFYIDVRKAHGPQAMDLQDSTLPEGTDFATLGQMAFPDSSESDWQ
jgi:hypothetical protein